MSSSPTRTLVCTAAQAINLPVVLRNGQSFRWQMYKHATTSTDISNAHHAPWYCGVTVDRVWLLRQRNLQTIDYRILARFVHGKAESMDEALLRQYLSLDNVDVGQLYQQWTDADGHFSNIVKSDDRSNDATCIGRFRHIRILTQRPFECLISFLCSQNNHVSRITGMIERLCARYGESVLCESDGCTYYNFPTIDKLCNDNVEDELRKLSFGYRAAYVSQTAKQIRDLGGETWLEGLRAKYCNYEHAKAQLLQLNGIGPKITLKHYMPQLRKVKTLTPAMYKEIGEFYRQRFGKMAGWAHSVLFTNDLRQFGADGIEIKSEIVAETRKRRIDDLVDEVAVVKKDEISTNHYDQPMPISHVHTQNTFELQKLE